MANQLNIQVANDTEKEQVIQQYTMEGYHIESDIGSTTILKKKGYSTGLLIVLLILGIVLGLIYYLICKEKVVTIYNQNPGSKQNNSKSQSTNQIGQNQQLTTSSEGSFCTNCGSSLKKDSKFCPECGTLVK